MEPENLKNEYQADFIQDRQDSVKFHSTAMGFQTADTYHRLCTDIHGTDTEDWERTGALHAVSHTQLGIEQVQACIVLANILRSRYVARTPPVETHSPGRRSNVENAPVDGQSPASQPRPLPIYATQFWERLPSPASHRPAARADPAKRSHYVVILGDGCKLVTRGYVAIATQPVHRLQICTIVHN